MLCDLAMKYRPALSLTTMTTAWRNARAVAEAVLNFAELNAESSQLDLVI